MKSPLLGLAAFSLMTVLQVGGLSAVARALEPPEASAVVLVVRLSNPQGELAAGIPVVAITNDPRIRIVADVLEVASGESPWPQGSTVAFLIHSPSRTLGGYEFPGKTYRMKLQPAGRDDPWSRAWVLVEVHEEPGGRPSHRTRRLSGRQIRLATLPLLSSTADRSGGQP